MEDEILTPVNQKYSVKRETLDALPAYRQDSRRPLVWNCLFVLPQWLKAWWALFGNDAVLDILSIRQQEEVLGLAPLQIKGDTAAFIGGTNVCDYLDFVVSSGREKTFFEVLLDHLAQEKIRHLDLGLLRPEATVLASLVEVAASRGCEVSTTPEDVSLELALPGSWDDYLALLNGKQRHEIKRKFRRLDEAGDVQLRVVEDAGAVLEHLSTFFDLFKMSSGEKADFMTDQMLSFFRQLAVAMAEAGMSRLYVLELNAAAVAASMCFDFNETLYLYNSGFDPHFRALSAGLLCKVLTIRNAIEKGRKKYDFLKGAETYKYRLGAKEVPLYRCKIRI